MRKCGCPIRLCEGGREFPDNSCVLFMERVACPSLGSREELFFMANIAAQAGCHDECLTVMKMLAQLGQELLPKERKLLSYSFSRVLLQRQHSLNTLESALERQGEFQQKRFATYRPHLERDCLALCVEAIHCFHQLLRFQSSVEFMVYCYRMKGDYCRYQAQFLSDDKNVWPSDVLTPLMRWLMASQKNSFFQPTWSASGPA